MPGSTPIRHYPYPLGSDPIRPAADIEALARAIDSDIAVAGWTTGDVKATIATVAPTGWLMFGQTYADAETAYPALWAMAPASWKSGTSLAIPPMDDRTIMGGGTLGAVGGANSRILATANLPSHSHTITHTHTVNHSHAAASTSNNGDHRHEFPASNNAIALTNLGGNQATPTGGTGVMSQMSPAGAHTHTVTVPTFNGSSGASSSASTGTAGSGTAFDTTPAHLRLNFLIKT